MKYNIECNWKFAMDNNQDFYHPSITHASANQSRFRQESPEMTALTDALSPRPFDLVRNKVYSMFGDSAAAHATAEEAAEPVVVE